MSRARSRAAGRTCLLVALAVLASACYSARAGFMPPASRLPELQPGVSSKAAVEALLGTPVGSGGVRFSPELERREIWVYAFLHFSGTGTDVDQGTLLVFFHEGRYDGHFWTTQGKPPPASKGRRR